MRIFRSFSISALLAASTCAVTPACAQGVTSWPSSGFDVHNTHWNSFESTLNTANVSGLVKQWAFTTQNDVSAVPSVDSSSNSVYFPDWSGNLYKLNANTGSIIWSHTMTYYGLPAGLISRSTPTLDGNLVIFGASATLARPNYSAGAYLVAVNATTGNLVWQTQVDSTLLAILTASPVVSGGVIYVGISSGQEKLATPTFRGSVVAVAETTGQVLWQTYMVPSGYSGGPIWSSTPVVDLARNQIYVTTGNNYSVPLPVQQCEVAAGSNQAAVEACQAADNYEDSIVALNITTGQVQWATKCSVTDAWNGTCLEGAGTCPAPQGMDLDFGAGANFFTVPVNGVPTDFVGAGQKSGVYWALNPSTGAVVWKQTVGPGGILGGMEWGTATDNQRIYVALSNSRRAPYQLQPAGALWNGASWAALDAATGRILWQVKDPGMDPIKTGSPALALGPVTVANGVVYCADTAGLMFALDAASGNTVWSFQAAGSVNAAPAVVNGTLFWGSGYHNFPASAPVGTASNTFYSFALPPPAATQTSLLSSLNPSVVGQSVILTAAVTPGTATGSITFLDGTMPLGNGVMTGGVAALSVSSLSAGSHSLAAVYSGDNADAASTSAVLTQTVSPLLTTTTLTSNPNPSVANQTVALAAVIVPVTASGTVNFFDGGAPLGSASVVQGGANLQASFSAGSHSLTAVYSGDASDSPSTSAVAIQIVSSLASSTTTAVTSSSNPSTFGHSVIFAATVKPSTATGLVTFYDGVTLLNSKPLVGGQASLTTSFLASGPRSIRAFYSGDAFDTGSTSPSVAQTVNSTMATGFQPAVSYGNLSNPVSVAFGDLNGDAKADLVIANYGSNDVAVMYGNGDGTFQAAQYVASGISAYAVTIYDLNGDGNPDLAIATQSGNSIAVTFGNGDGTFQTPVNYPVGAYPVSIALADFNGDGIADLATANAGSNNVSVLLGNGNGTLQTAVNYGAGTSPGTVVVGDFNGDGKPDIAIGSQGDDCLDVLLGNGDGTFQMAAAYSVGGQPLSVVVGDFNADGKLDVAAATQGAASVSVLLGNGDGTFQAPASYTIGSGSSAAIAAGDLNGDGKLDLAVADQVNSTVGILFGNGDGTFSPGATYAAGGVAQALGTGEFNGDGRSDLAAVNPAANSISVLLGSAPQVATTITLLSAINPSVFGQSVAFTASVTPATATGTVTIVDGTTTIGSGPLSNGLATVTPPLLSAGTHTLTAIYSGDNNDSPSNSAPLTQAVTQATTATVFTSSANPSPFGSPLLLSATVSPSTATGTVTFLNGSTSMGTATLSGGVASFGTSTLTVGPHTLTAAYSGDANNFGSTSAPYSETINRALTSTNLTLSPNPAALGQPIALTATVSPASATGSVTFRQNSVTIGSSTISGGVATLSIPSLAAGQYSFSASYGGNGTNAPSSSVAVTVKRITTVTTLTSSANPATHGQTITFTATVTPGTATGQVIFLDGSTPIGSCTLTGGVATFRTQHLTTGNHSITANYTGDPNNLPSTSVTLVQTVQ